jgi:hypothetical protein
VKVKIFENSNLQQMFNCSARMKLKFTLKKLNSDIKQVWQVEMSVFYDKLRI